MAVFKGLGKGIGTVGGGLIGGAIMVTGKAVGTKWKGTGEWIQDVGGDVHSASKTAMETAGQFVDGAVQGTYGIIKKDEYYKQKGKGELKDSTLKTIKGIGDTVKYTANNAGVVFNGIRYGNKEQAVEGLKNVGKIVAISGLAIGIVDVVDGVNEVEAEQIETRNDHLSGAEHTYTGVPFVEKTIELQNGTVVEGTFPAFDSKFTSIISEDLYLASDEVHFSVANDTLYQAIQNNPSLMNELGLSEADIQALASGQTPEGYTWHHHEEPGVIQLVDEEIHQQTGHTGGRSIWGGGSESR